MYMTLLSLSLSLSHTHTHTHTALSLERLPEVRRLITLIDVLYDHRVKVVV